MRDRLLKFMEAEHLQASRLAEILGVQPATISHILNGRNRPSFEFIEKLLQRFPKMNPDWLILGKGNLYRSELQNPRAAREHEATPFSPAQMSFEPAAPESSAPTAPPQDLFTTSPQNLPHQPSNPANQHPFAGQNSPSNSENISTKSEFPSKHTETKRLDSERSMPVVPTQIQDSDIERIVIFLKDGTCIPYKPR